MLNIKWFLATTVALSGIVFTLTNCSLNDEKKESNSKESVSCFLIAEPAVVAPGSTAEIKPGPDFSWDKYRSVTVEGLQTLSSASTAGVKVTPTNSRSYPVTAVRADGTQTTCSVAIKVTGKDFDAVCTLIADPATLTVAQEVNVTLQVSGTEQVAVSKINQQTVGEAAGGSATFTVNKTEKFYGSIAAADGRTNECLTIVEFINPTASDECKAEPSAEDKKKNADANASYTAENTAAREAKLTAVSAGRSDFTGVLSKNYAGYANEESSLCQAITGSANTAGCSMKTNATLGNGFKFATVDVSGQLYELYSYNKAYGSVTVVQEADGTPTPILLAAATDYVEEIEVEICECVYPDQMNDKSNAGISADVAEQKDDFIWYKIAAGKRVATYKGEAVNTFVKKAASIKKKIVQPPVGTPKPECPQDWNQAT